MQSKNSVVVNMRFFLISRFSPILLLLILSLCGELRGEGKEILLINGSQVYSFSRDEFNVSKTLLNDENMVHYLVDQYPVFQHTRGLKNFVESLIEYPEEAIDNHVEGVVLVNFIVEKDGTISNPRFIRTLGYGCEEEVLRVIDRFPVATPGKISEQPVRVGITLPIRFKLQYN
ncbi:MAG: energy transducer TonB [Bacteroidetes bacterium]|nr:MAG: energy transducer TonB [Bacteroidota bacterium]